MKKNITVAIILISIKLFSQQLVVNSGAEEKETRRQSIYIGGDDEVYYTVDVNEKFIYNGYNTLSNEQKSCILNKYSAKGYQLLYKKPINFPDLEKNNHGLFEFIYLKGKLYLFFSRFSGKPKMTKLFYAKINDDGTLNADYKLIDEMPQNKNSTGYFIVQLSVDKNEILTFREDPWMKNQNEKFVCKVFDENMNVKWSKNIELPYKSDRCIMSQQVRLNGGNFYLFGYDLVSNSNPDDKTIKNNVICYNPKSDKINEGVIETGFKNIWDVRFKFSKTGNLICAGLASNKEVHGYGPKGNKLHAAFYFEFDKNVETTVSKQVKNLEQDLIGLFGNWNYYLKNIILINDKVTLVCQQDYTNLERSGSIGSADRGGTYHSYYQDIMILTLDTKSATYLLKRIKQNQTDQPVYGSFLLLSDEKGFSILVNAPKEDVNYSPAENQNDFDYRDLKEKGNVTVSFNFTADGKVKIEKVFDNGLLLRMNNNHVFKDNEAYICIKTTTGEKPSFLSLK